MAKIVPPMNFGLVEDGQSPAHPYLTSRSLSLRSAVRVELFVSREAEFTDIHLGRRGAAFRDFVRFVSGLLLQSTGLLLDPAAHVRRDKLLYLG